MKSTFNLLLEFERFRRAGITTLNRGSIMIAICNQPGIRSRQLAEVIQNTAVNIQPAVRKLVKLGLIQVERNEDRNRGAGRTYLKYFPTDKGRKLVGGSL